MNLEKVSKYLIYLIIILGAFFPIASYVLMGIIIINIILLKKEQEIIIKLRNNIILLMMVISMILSSIFSEIWYVSVFFSIFFIIQVLFSISVSTFLDESDFSRVLSIIMYLGIAVSVIGLFQYYFQIGNIQKSWIDKNVYNIDFRVYSTFFNPNILAIFLNLTIITSVVSITETNKTKILVPAAICTMTSTVCLLLTYSRGGWIPLCISFVLLGIFDRRFLKYIVVFGAIFGGFDYASDVGRLMPQKIVIDSSVGYRIKLWKASFDIIQDNPILGIGKGTVWNKIPEYSNTITAYVSHVHNVFLQILVDTGVVGATVFVIFIKDIWNRIKFNIKKKQSIGLITKVSLGFYVTLIVNGFFDAVCLQSQISIFVWFLIGINFIDEKANDLELMQEEY
ncbi:O-antigen ligase family protein [Brassicibacter mesophilus]|uniref:O-antigen ligase family protein n=1 Tax=Brassicibacter mesophilus TaxID=745119 RepID=UPI003D1C16AD